jgi:hypothetical protein
MEREMDTLVVLLSESEYEGYIRTDSPMEEKVVPVPTPPPPRVSRFNRDIEEV